MKRLNDAQLITQAVIFAERHLYMNLLARILVTALLVSGGAGLIVLLLSRLVYLPYLPVFYTVVFLASLAAVTVLSGVYKKRIAPFQAAREIDRKYGLAELVLTSYEGINSAAKSEFSELALSRAVEVLESTDMRRDFGLQAPSNSGYLPVVAILTVSVFFFSPAVSRQSGITIVQEKQAGLLSELSGETPSAIQAELEKLIAALKEPSPARPAKLIGDMNNIRKNIEAYKDMADAKEQIELVLRSSAGESTDAVPLDSLLDFLKTRLSKSAPSDEILEMLREKILQAGELTAVAKEKKQIDDSLKALNERDLVKAYEAILEFLGSGRTDAGETDLERLAVRLESARNSLIDAYKDAEAILPGEILNADEADGESAPGFSSFHAAPAFLQRPSMSQIAEFKGVNERYREIIKKYFSR